MASAPKITLNNGLHMPVLGLGTYTAAPVEMVNVIKSAIDRGYRHFDCALVYQNEKYVGEAIKQKIAEGVVKREDLFVVSKLWNTYHRPDLVIKGCKKTLENLGLDYVDLFLIHWPTPFQSGKSSRNYVIFPETFDPKAFQTRLVDNTTFKIPTIQAADEIKKDKEVKDGAFIMEYPEFFPVDENKQIIPGDVDYIYTWKAMEECVDLGYAKSIGISNFNSVQIDRLLKTARIKPVTNQIELNPYMNQKKMIDFCMKRDIWITAYGPLGLQIPLTNFERPRLVENPKIIALAEELNKTPAQVILRYLVQLKTIPIPKTSNIERLSENLSVFDFELNDQQMSVMDSLNCNQRLCIIPGTEKHKNYPFGIEF